MHCKLAVVVAACCVASMITVCHGASKDETDDRAAFEKLRENAPQPKDKKSEDPKTGLTTPQLIYLVKIQEFDETFSYKLMSDAEAVDFDAALRMEARQLRKAYTLAEKSWNEDQGNKDIRYPLVQPPSARRLTRAARFKDKQKADDSLKVIAEREKKRQEEQKAQENKKLEKSSDQVKLQAQRKIEQYAKALSVFKDKLGELVEEARIAAEKAATAEEKQPNK